MKLVWDKQKRQANLFKHGLDFADALLVLESHYRLDIEIIRNGEQRVQSLSYVIDRLAVLSVVHTARRDAVRVISLRPASQTETEKYHEWLSQDID